MEKGLLPGPLEPPATPTLADQAQHSVQGGTNLMGGGRGHGRGSLVLFAVMHELTRCMI